MEINKQKIIDNLNSAEALKVVCLFLAQNDDPIPPHEELGFSTQAEAFEKIAVLFNSKARTVQNERDAFDYLTDSSRAGWQKELPPRLKPIWENFGELQRPVLQKTAKNILGKNWGNTTMPELPELSEVIAECRGKISVIDENSAFSLAQNEVEKLLSSYQELFPSNDINLIGGHTFLIGTGLQTRHISIQEVPKLAILADNLRALEAYRVKLDEIATQMGFGSRTGDGAKFFDALPNENWKTQVQLRTPEEFSDAVAAVLNSVEDQEKMFRFISDPDWSGLKKPDGTIGRKLNRSTDWQESAILKTGDLVAAASAGRINLIRAMEAAGFGANLVEKTDTPNFLLGGDNTIYYGAPGTGKSYTVDGHSKGDIVIRTVFHPDVQNSDFVGTLKPVREDDEITYRFSPGPFSLALAEAMNNPGSKVWLVIEELNRAPAASVFGDLFLLLDRDGDGRGEYDVNCPSEEFAHWYAKETGDSSGKIRLPSNLWIAATMNSADQGVFPLDTAFRRRWDQIYIPIDYNSGPSGSINFVPNDGTKTAIDWHKFVKALNEHLTTELSVAEDRLVGPWFVKEAELGEEGALPGKVLIYLWDDLLRHHGREAVFKSDIKTYGDLSKRVENETSVFSETFLDKLVAIAPATTGND